MRIHYAPKQLVEHSLHCDASPSFMDDCDTVNTTAQDCTESNGN